MREWTIDPSGSPYRLPPQGPRVTTGDASLVLVAEDYTVYLIIVRSSQGNHLVAKCSLLKPRIPATATQHQAAGPLVEPIPTRKCVGATVGVHYSDSSIYVAYRSRSSPIPPAHALPYDSSVGDEDLFGLPCDLGPLGVETEVRISLLTVLLRENLAAMDCTTLRTIDKVKHSVTDMSFISFPPEKGAKDSTLMLGLSTLEMDEYDSSIPAKSSLRMFSITAPANPPHRPQAVEQTAHRTFDGVLSFVFPVSQTLGNTDRLLFAGVVDSSSATSKTYVRRNEVAVGLTRVINAGDLSDNYEWESTPLWSSSQRTGGIGVPISAAMSPNGRQVLTASSALWHSHSTLNALPRRHRKDGDTSPEGIAIALASLTRKSTADILHSLPQSTASQDTVVDILTAALKTLQKCQRLPAFTAVRHLTGVALEIYRALARNCKDEDERQRYTNRWQAAHDLMSIVGCLTAFRGVNEKEALWQLTKIATWLVEFLKRLLKACVTATNVSSDKPQDDADDLFGSTPSSPVSKEHADPILINLVHPFALEALFCALESVQKFKDAVDRNTLTDEVSAIGRDVVDDLIDTCPAQIPEFLNVLSEAKEVANKLDVNILNEVVASCQPTPAVRGYLDRVIAKITQSETLLDRARLFIEPDDLVDGVARMSLNAQPRSKEVDIVTKAVLDPTVARPLRCIRCGGHHQALWRVQNSASNSVSIIWRIWERSWSSHCICDGYWEVKR